MKRKTGFPTILAECKNQNARLQNLTSKTLSVTGYNLPSFTNSLSSSKILELIGTSFHLL
ncbi:hypothetical protein PGB90_009299 [Kerria lacca]